MKVLILSCNTGQGHNTASKALIEELTARGIESEMRDALAFDSRFVSDAVSNIHAKAAIHIPKAYGVGVRAAKLMDEMSKKHSVCYFSNISYATKLYRYIVDNGYDTIVLPHVFPSEAMTRIKRHIDPSLSVRTYFIATDYSYPPFLKETTLDTYFIPHEDLISEFEEAGVPGEKIIASGIPVAERFHVPVSKADARAELGLPVEGRILLVMTGSMGYGNTEELTDRLLEAIPDHTYVLVMGGNNEKMKTRLRTVHAGDDRLTVLDYTQKVSLYLSASDLLFTKPGGLSSTEAAVRGIPLLHTKPIPGWEEDNIRFFRSHGMSDYGEDTDALVTKALFLLGNPHRCEEMVESQRATVNPFAARDIVDKLIADAAVSE